MNSIRDTSTTARKVFLAISVAGTLLGCGDPCEDYCEVFVRRTQECGLGGPSGDAAAEQCGDDVSDVITDDACETASSEVSSMSCDEFVAGVCSQPGAETTYNCN